MPNLKNLDQRLDSKNRVLAAVSGGVDSSVSIFLLKKMGFKVDAVHFLIPKDDSLETLDYDEKNLEKVKKICKQFKVELSIVDIRKEFKNELIDYVINSYKNGITPNPCVICNRKIKFKNLLLTADKKNIFKIATGHYARKEIIEDVTFIKRALDQKKDQSYFLVKLNQSIIDKTIFPLGGYKKKDIYKFSEKLNLGIEKSEESSGLCFLKNDFSSFIKKHIPQKRGKIRDQNDKELGVHNGLFNYTLGQRKGIEIGGDGPYFVTSKDFENNILYVSNIGDDKNLFFTEIIFKISHIEKKRRIKIKEIIQKAKKDRVKLFAKIRYGQVEEEIMNLDFLDNRVLITLQKPVRAVTHGQICAIYTFQGVLLIGGEII